MISSKPSQYLKGWVEFYKLKFKVTPDVLIPRPETELLVDEVLNILRNERSELRSYHKNINSSYGKFSPPVGGSNNNKQPLTILDLGTGSGNIAISLACKLKGCNVKIIATDISLKALKVAKQNAKLHGIEDKITFLQSNLLDVIASKAKQSSSENNPTQIASSKTPRNDIHVDIIVTNLPYIPTARIPYLDCSVKDFEPLIALDGGEDGFELYRKLFKQIKQNGWVPKLLIGEIDYTHGELAAVEAQKYFPQAKIEVKTDLAQKQRILLVWQLL